MKHLSLLTLALLFSLNNFAQEQTKESKKMYIEIKGIGISGGWMDKPKNYRGIPIRLMI